MAGFGKQPAAAKSGSKFEGKKTFTFLCAGTGITPIVQALHKLLNTPGDERKIVLLYGSKSPEDILCKEQLDEWARAHPHRLEVVHVVSRPGDGWDGETGRIRTDVLDRVLPTDRRERAYFLCASGPVMDAVTVALATLGIPDAHVSAERFAMA